MGKKFLIFIFSALTLVVPMETFGISYEVFRSQQSPGYFLLKIFPEQNAKPVEKEKRIFIANFSSEKSNFYDPIIAKIQKRGGQIVSPSQEPELSVSSKNDIFVLGEPYKLYPYFSEETEADESFDVFWNKMVESEKYAKDLQVSFGGNISQTIIENPNFRGKSPALVIGKFQAPRKTRFEVMVRTNNGIETFKTDVPLESPEFISPEISPKLQDLWFTQNKKSQAYAPSSVFTKSNVGASLLWGLFILGFIFIFLGIFSRKKKEHPALTINFEGTKSPTKQNKKDSEFSYSVPFEVE